MHLSIICQFFYWFILGFNISFDKAKCAVGFRSYVIYGVIPAEVFGYSYAQSVLQLGYEGRGVQGRALFAQSYKNEGSMCHVMCLVLRHVTNIIPFQNKYLKNRERIKLTFKH